MKGYKIFDCMWECLGKQYSCPGRFVEEGVPVLREHGMHFCEQIIDCLNEVGISVMDTPYHIAEVIAHGDIDSDEDDFAYCTNDLEIVREIPWDEVLRIVNLGIDCTGVWNVGSWNEGDSNSGDHNLSSHNSGDWNRDGDFNSGNNNRGSYNSGDWNATSHSSGCFNTIEPKINMFNKPSDWTYSDWASSKACGIMRRINFADSPQQWWDGLTQEERSIIKALPNFDAAIFYECTGVKVE